jgi:hypothetical protein
VDAYVRRMDSLNSTERAKADAYARRVDSQNRTERTLRRQIANLPALFRACYPQGSSGN